jgi:hypothetical protein
MFSKLTIEKRLFVNWDPRKIQCGHSCWKLVGSPANRACKVRAAVERLISVYSGLAFSRSELQATSSLFYQLVTGMAPISRNLLEEENYVTSLRLRWFRPCSDKWEWKALQMKNSLSILEEMYPLNLIINLRPIWRRAHSVNKLAGLNSGDYPKFPLSNSCDEPSSTLILANLPRNQFEAKYDSEGVNVDVSLKFCRWWQQIRPKNECNASKMWLCNLADCVIRADWAYLFVASHFFVVMKANVRAKDLNILIGWKVDLIGHFYINWNSCVLCAIRQLNDLILAGSSI